VLFTHWCKSRDREISKSGSAAGKEGIESKVTVADLQLYSINFDKKPNQQWSR
jgi:hypothetical protein